MILDRFSLQNYCLFGDLQMYFGSYAKKKYSESAKNLKKITHSELTFSAWSFTSEPL